MELWTITPLAHGRGGFPRDEEGRPYLPGRDLLEAVLAAAFLYATRKDAGFKRRIERALSAEHKDLKALARALEDELFARYPFLEKLAPPERLYPDGEVRPRRAILVDLKKGDIVRDEEVEVFEGIIPLPWELKEDEKNWLAAAGRSMAEALATMELELVREDLPVLEPFYQDLKSRRLKGATWPLRVGYWGEDPFRARLLAFRRVPEVKRALGKLGYQIEPRRLLYLPKDKVTLGWAKVVESQDR